MTERVTGPAFYFPSIERKYGKPVGYWLDLVSSSELTSHKALVDWLKADYGIGHGHATALVGYALVQRPQPLALPQANTKRGPVPHEEIIASLDVTHRYTLGHGTVAPELSEVSQCVS